MNIFILGANGFIGHHLSQRILQTTPWNVVGLDIQADGLDDKRQHPRFQFVEGDITRDQDRIERCIQACDVVIPLVAIATPSVYISDPLKVFELDFEANLPIVRAAVRHGKRLIFPSSSEVYGMSTDESFDADASNLVYGPIHKTRWIYASAKQMMDRLIHAYGQQSSLRFTLVRPFNWIGPGLDSIDAAKEGSSRVVTEFLGRIMRGEDIPLVDGGLQRRCFTDVSDGIDALMRILQNPGGVADGKIYNIGNPANDLSIAELAAKMLAAASVFPEYAEAARRVHLVTVAGESYYGAGYQDMTRRVPAIANITADLQWLPRVPIDTALQRLFSAYRGQALAQQR